MYSYEALVIDLRVFFAVFGMLKASKIQLGQGFTLLSPVSHSGVGGNKMSMISV